MRATRSLDYFLLVLLAILWASAFFNIKIATYSYGPLTIAFLRIFFWRCSSCFTMLFQKN